MLQIGGKNAKKTSSDSKRHFTVVIDSGDKGGTNVPPKEHGLYVSSSPSSAAKKAVTKLCTANKGKKVEFYIREITQGSKKKTYGPYMGYIEKLKEPIELKGRVIQYKPVAKLSSKASKKMRGGVPVNEGVTYSFNNLSEQSGKISSNATAKGNQILNKNINDAKRTKFDAKRIANEATAKSEKQRETAKLARLQANTTQKNANEKKLKANNAKNKAEESKQIFNNLQLNNSKTAANTAAQIALNSEETAKEEENATTKANLEAKSAVKNAEAASQAVKNAEAIKLAKKNANATAANATAANATRNNKKRELNPSAPEFKPASA